MQDKELKGEVLKEIMSMARKSMVKKKGGEEAASEMSADADVETEETTENECPKCGHCY